MEPIENGTLRRGRVYDAASRRWYRDGYAPFQLPEFIRADCLRCGGRGTLRIFARAALCEVCTFGREPHAGD